MGRGPHARAQRPELSLALRWLRHRRHLTQREVAAEAARLGRPFSAVYYQQAEAGARRPGPAKLAAMLAALGSDERELDGLLAHRPWAGIPDPAPGYRVSKHTPKPADYVAAARESLAPRPDGATWSSPVREAAPAPIAGEVAELADHYVHLPRAAQEDLLARARAARAGLRRRRR